MVFSPSCGPPWKRPFTRESGFKFAKPRHTNHENTRKDTEKWQKLAPFRGSFVCSVVTIDFVHQEGMREKKNVDQRTRSQRLDTLSETELAQVAEFVAFLKFRARFQPMPAFI